jgi:glycosyltransferase involved in cell wall biosynthesis
MRISIAMATFNGATYLRNQLESLASQSRPPDEIVIVDDCSRDGTELIAKSFADAGKIPVKFVKNPVQLGVTANFEKAMMLCSGDVLFTSDQDDVWLPRKIETMVREFTDESALLVVCDASLVDRDLRPLSRTLWDSVGFRGQEYTRSANGQAFEVLIRRNFVAGMAMAIRKSFLEKIKPFPKEWVHDGWAALVAAAYGGVRVVPEALVNYRLHGKNAIGVQSFTFADKLRLAWELPRKALLEKAEQMEVAAERLKYVVEPQRLRLMQNLSVHFRARTEMPRQRRERIPLVWRELSEGRYHSFSHGLSAALRDLIR